MAELAKDFPKGLTYTIPFDTTVFVSASVNEVYHTLFEAGLLVLIVIVVFLQNWRATLCPRHRASDDHWRLCRDGGNGFHD
jgi:Cation/multidrug efflux pump